MNHTIRVYKHEGFLLLKSINITLQYQIQFLNIINMNNYKSALPNMGYDTIKERKFNERYKYILKSDTTITR